MAQLALPLVQAVTGAIPLVGAPMQAAIGGLLTGLQAIDVRALTTLRERCLASTSVTQAIAGCFVKIDRYLAEYLVVFYSLTNFCTTLTILL
ncbi:uncharacterized protein BJ212DRAFT_1400088, partial [Suillus subaureus]